MSSVKRSPKLGFLGAGWIGRHRMQKIAESGLAQAFAVCEPSEAMLAEAIRVSPDLRVSRDLHALLEHDLDGIVIATPSALHAEQTMTALKRGLPVFCQKPLGRSGEEVERVIEGAKQADRLLGVDLSYRFIDGIQKIKNLIASGEIGEVYAVDLTFHNAYGPDKPWFYEPKLSGGGCIMDLGVHLVDLALWIQDFPRLRSVSSRLYSGGRPLQNREYQVEDYGVARLDLENGAAVQLQCSWKLPAGVDCIIGATFYGTRGGLSFRNVNGSFYDFTAERFHGTKREVLSLPPEEWGGLAAIDWAKRLSESCSFDPSASRFLEVSRALDRIYDEAV